MKALLTLICASFFLSCAQMSEDGQNLQEFKKRFPATDKVEIDRNERRREKRNDLRL